MPHLKEYRILHLEDSQSDADLVKRQLQKAQLNFTYFLARNKEMFLEGLDNFNPSVILCDHALPQFDSLLAHEIYMQRDLKIPFILVTGSVSEEYAVAMIKSGIDDYLLKTNLQRLAQAIQNALVKREHERKIKEAEEQKEFDRNNTRALINNTSDLMWSIDTQMRLIISNRNFEAIIQKISGTPVNPGTHLLEFGFPKEKLDLWFSYYERALMGETFTVTEPPDKVYAGWVEISFYPIYKDNNIVGTACFARDISDRKNAERKLKQQYDQLSEIAFMLSHQARAPIASILGLINLIDFNNPGSEKNVEVLSNLKKTTSMFDKVIHSIMQSTSEIDEITREKTNGINSLQNYHR
ncbi:MAG TPA: response regulator [Flavobacteriales bacterium]|nr:response regulator [Flavobacteriales bacterium]